MTEGINHPASPAFLWLPIGVTGGRNAEAEESWEAGDDI